MTLARRWDRGHGHKVPSSDRHARVVVRLQASCCWFQIVASERGLTAQQPHIPNLGRVYCTALLSNSKVLLCHQSVRLSAWSSFLPSAPICQAHSSCASRNANHTVHRGVLCTSDRRQLSPRCTANHGTPPFLTSLLLHARLSGRRCLVSTCLACAHPEHRRRLLSVFTSVSPRACVTTLENAVKKGAVSEPPRCWACCFLVGAAQRSESSGWRACFS